MVPMTEPTALAPIVVGPWRRLTRRQVYANAWITVWHDEVDRPDGSPGIYGVVHYANEAVGVVVLDDDDRVLLVGQYRYTLDRYSWEIPEGGSPPGEPAVEGAKRELEEETGVIADEWRPIVRFTLSNSISDEAGVLYAAHARDHGEPHPDPTEDLAVRWVPLDEAIAMIRRAEIVDGMSIMALQAVALERAAGGGAAGGGAATGADS
jgi:8-oxo-dGTP pyrophosphatase MutT (NUDIX family)